MEEKRGSNLISPLSGCPSEKCPLQVQVCLQFCIQAAVVDLEAIRSHAWPRPITACQTGLSILQTEPEVTNVGTVHRYKCLASCVFFLYTMLLLYVEKSCGGKNKWRCVLIGQHKGTGRETSQTLHISHLAFQTTSRHWMNSLFARARRQLNLA